MSEFIKILLSLSVSGTLLLLFILGLKQIYRNKFSRRWQYYIWIIVVLRFLLPFTLDTMNIISHFYMFCVYLLKSVLINDEEHSEGVLIGEPKKVDGVKTQEVWIVYNFVGEL